MRSWSKAALSSAVDREIPNSIFRGLVSSTIGQVGLQIDLERLGIFLHHLSRRLTPENDIVEAVSRRDSAKQSQIFELGNLRSISLEP